MDTDTFWSLIDRSRAGHEDDVYAQERALSALLRGMPREELIAFDRLYQQQLARAYRWDVWGAGYVLAGGMSDDSFSDFCDWLVSRGRETFEQVLADPDSLADVPGAEPDAINAEGFWAAVHDAYEQTYASEFPVSEDDAQDWPEEPAGEPWDDDDLDHRYPRLTAKTAD